MLKIGYGCPDDIYFYIDLEFDTLFRMEWLEDEMNQRILREVDHCIYNGFRMQDLEDGYTFAIDDISTGSKALMLVNELEDIQIWGTAFGDNCLNLLLQMAEKRILQSICSTRRALKKRISGHSACCLDGNILVMVNFCQSVFGKLQHHLRRSMSRMITIDISDGK